MVVMLIFMAPRPCFQFYAAGTSQVPAWLGDGNVRTGLISFYNCSPQPPRIGSSNQGTGAVGSGWDVDYLQHLDSGGGEGGLLIRYQHYLIAVCQDLHLHVQPKKKSSSTPSHCSSGAEGEARRPRHPRACVLARCISSFHYTVVIACCLRFSLLFPNQLMQTLALQHIRTVEGL